jgi:secreted PhoX family phosphatase
MDAQSRSAIAILVVSSILMAAHAESHPCVNNAPDGGYHDVGDWAQTPRPLAGLGGIFVDSKDNVWLFDRCGNKGCANSNEAPIFEISPEGKVLKNIGAGLFVFPHGITVDSDGNVWAVDGNSSKDGRGMQVTKLSPDGTVLMKLGKAGQSGTGLDVFNKPTAVAIASNGDIFIAEGHRTGVEGQPQDFGNSRIVKFDKNGTFIKTFGHVGNGDGELMGPHSLAFDSQGRLFVADRANSRIVIYSQDGEVLANWTQFSRPSGIFINHDVLYVSDDQSEDKNTSVEWWPAHPGCKRGVRVGSAKTGKVKYYFPNPHLTPEVAKETQLFDGTADVEGLAADSHGNVYLATARIKTVFKYSRH